MAIFTGTINAETLTGDIGNDDMFGDAGNDTLVGAAGNDTLDGGLGADSLVGGAGNDLYVVDDIGDVVVEVPAEGTDVVQSSITYTLTSDVEQLVLTGALIINGTGNALDNVLTGNTAANSLDGGAGNDALSGGDGNDTLIGGSGNDKLDGGTGTDSLVGGLGDDSYVGDNASDVVVEAAGEGYDLLTTKTAYTLVAGVEVEEITLFNDTVSGSTFDHNFGVTANEFNNIITGNKGDNVINAGGGNDTIDTTAGGADTITLGAGNDSVVLSLIGPVVITDFNPAEDRLDLGTVLKELTDKTALGYDNPFTKGYMQMVASGADTLVQVNDQTGTGWQTIATLQNVAPAAITLTNFRYNLDPNSVLNSHTTAVTLTAVPGNGNAILEGWDGNDTITGGTGNDLLDGGFGGADSISGGDGIDTIFGFGGNDTLDGGANGDFIYGGSGNDLILGGAGDDWNGSTLTYKGTSYIYENIALEGGDGNDTVDGGIGDDKLSGGHGDDSLIGGLGADYLVDAAGNDTMLGGEGNDSLNDNGDGGVLFGEAGADELTLNLDTFYGGKAVASLLDGGADNDVLNVLTNASGSVLRGGTGNDTIYAFSSGLNWVVADGGAGDDNITNNGVSNSAWTITGGEGNDRIEMGGHFHQIDAGAGNDTIDFEVSATRTGSGIVTTGAGADVIELSLRAVLDQGPDDGLFRAAAVVTDFSAGIGGDKLDLSSVIDRLGPAAGTDPFAGGYLRLVASGANTYIEGTTTPGAGAVYTTIAVLQGVAPAALTAANFVQAVTPVVAAGTAPVVELPHSVALQGSGATPLGIVAPTGGTLTITLSSVPDASVGVIQTANGTQVYAGNTLTAEQLAGLTFTPVLGVTGNGASLFYSVTDDAGNKIRTAVLLETPNTAPTVNVTDQVYTADGATPFSYDLKTVVSDAQTSDNLLTYAVTVNGGALPAWLNYDPLAHVLSGTPPAGTDVAVNISLTVTDLKGVATTVGFIITPPGATIDGTAGADSLTGHAGNDVLNGLAGNDTLDGGAGKDTMVGGLGDDSYVVDNAGDVVTESVGAGTDTVIASVNHTLADNVENLTLNGTATNGGGNALANVLTGNALDNQLSGADGDDTLTGGAGNDTLYGGSGANALQGGSGDDTYMVDSATDAITENTGEGADMVIASVNHTLSDNVENLTLSGAATNGGGNALTNVLTGNARDNQLSGADGNDTLIGGAGNDTLVGGGGTDALQGGVGDDTYMMDSAADVITENASEGTDTVMSSITYVLGANLDNLTLQGGGVINGYGNSLANGITGNASDNSLLGELGNDTLNGGEGNDFIVGGAGADSMLGGVGNDTYGVDNVGDVVTENTGEGTDTVISAISYTLGADVENLTLHVSGGAINGYGNTLANVITGNASNNLIDGGAAGDLLYGGAGSDTLIGGIGSDSMAGGVGNDSYSVDSIGDSVTENAGEGVDTVRSSVTYVLGANVENLTLDAAGGAINGYGNVLGNTLIGNDSDNSLLGDAGSDQIFGGGGNDFIVGGTGADTMQGGAGNDTYGVDSIGDIVTENAGEGTDTVISAVTFVLGSNIENLTLHASGGAINGYGNILGNTLVGNDSDNSLLGDAGSDLLIGGGGNDFIVGGTGADTMRGGVGDDTYGVDSIGDIVTENAAEGIDTVISTVTFVLGANVENLTLHASGGAISGYGNALGNVIVGNDSDNSLLGDAGSDLLIGGGGNDFIVGGMGADTMRGGAGDDTYGVDSIGDIVTENAGQGTDTVISAVTFVLGTNVENLTLHASGGAISGYGSAANNVITGNASDNSLFGDLGNDTLNGGAGNDFIVGGAGIDSMLGGAGNDTFGVDNVNDMVVENAGEGTDTIIASVSYTLGANVENLTLHVSGGAINGSGNALANVIIGNASNNVLIGGIGNDTLTGGLGADHFVFNSALNAATNVDTLADYAVGADHIDLAAAVFGGAGGVGAAVNFFSGAGLSGSTSAAQSAGVYYDTSTGNLYYDADGFGGSASVKFATVAAHPVLTAADFSIIA